MNNTEYIREAAKKNKWIKYYMLERPVSISTQPKAGMMDYINYDEKREADNHMVWAEIYYNRELTEKEMTEYEIVKAK